MSTVERTTRRRMIVELCHGSTDEQTLRTVAELASFLELELHGLFIEDEALLALAELPFVREIRLPTHEWQKIDADRMANELRGAAEGARRMLRGIAGVLNLPNAFEVRRGDPGETIAAIASELDVIVLGGPVAPGSQVASGFARIDTATRDSMASLLLLPDGLKSRAGPVVALLARSDDPALLPAARVALNTKERLLLLLPQDVPSTPDDVVDRAAALGVAPARITTRSLGGLDAEDVTHALGHVRERLIVLTRDASAAGDIIAASRIAADRGVPVLLVASYGSATSRDVSAR